MAEQGLARQMMAQRLMTEKRDDPFSGSRFFNAGSTPDQFVRELPDPVDASLAREGANLADVAYGTAATGTLFAPGAGVADVFGYAPDPFNRGEFLPSFGENISAGNYLDAGLQTLGVAGDVMMAGGAFVPPLVGVGAALKAPRAARVAGQAADAAQVSPNQQMGDALAAAQARYFETGSFEPPTAENPVSVVLPTETEPGIIAFHGSGADFDEFRLEMIGTGEGAQAYGYGLYFTDSEDIAKFYRNAMVDRDRGLGNVRIKYKGESFAEFEDSAAAEADPIKYRMLAALGRQIERPVTMRPMDDPEKVAQVAKDELLQSIDRNIEMQRKAFANESASVQATMEDTLLADIIAERDALARIDPADIEVDAPTGKIYKVALQPKPSQLLNYDGPPSDDVKAKVLQALEGKFEPVELPSGEYGIRYFNENVGAERNVVNVTFGTRKGAERLLNATGAEILNIAEAIAGGKKEGAALLNDAGIPGIKYFSGNSRTTAGGKLIDVSQGDDGFRAKVAVENRSIGGKGRVITTSPPYKTEQEALDWAEEATKRAERNYVIFDDNAVRILEKYGVAGPVLVTGGAVAATQRGGDEEGSIFPDA